MRSSVSVNNQKYDERTEIPEDHERQDRETMLAKQLKNYSTQTLRTANYSFFRGLSLTNQHTRANTHVCTLLPLCTHYQ